MAHYSEMDFLFGDTYKDNISVALKETSQNNTFNILKDPKLSGRPGYVVFKSKKNLGTEGIKNYLQTTIYKHEQESNNPYVNIIKDFSITEGSEGAGLRLKASDFAYLRDLGVYPMNRMAILRRFPEGNYVSEDLDRMKIEPISTIVGWIPADKNFSTVSFNETWSKTNERFDVALANIIKKATHNAVDIAAIIPVPDFAQGVLFEFYKRMGLEKSSGVNDSVDETYEYYNPDGGLQNGSKDTNGNTWGLKNIPVGDPNVLQEGPFRNPEGQNIKSDFTFELETTYEQKLLGDVDPGSAMLDILDNIFAMGTSNMVFYWGDGSPIIQKAKSADSYKANSLNAWWEFVKTITTSFWETLTSFLKQALNEVKKNAEKLIESGKSNDQKNQSSSTDIQSQISKQTQISNNSQKRMNDILKAYPNDGMTSGGYKEAQNQKIAADKKIKELQNSGTSNSDSAQNVDSSLKNTASNIANDLINAAISGLETILTSTIAIHRFQLRGSIELMVGGKDSSTPWHLTIGNPYSPWLNTNHIIIESATVETSNEMGFNDMPQRLTAKFTCKFSRALGKQELMRMFNNTYRRTYSSSSSITPPTPMKAEKNKNEENTTADTTGTVGTKTSVVSSSDKNPGVNGNTNDPSIVNYLASKNQDYSYGARKKMAANLGIQNYKGTAEQNTQILNTLRGQNNA